MTASVAFLFGLLLWRECSHFGIDGGFAAAEGVLAAARMMLKIINTMRYIVLCLPWVSTIQDPSLRSAFSTVTGSKINCSHGATAFCPLRSLFSPFQIAKELFE